VTANTAIAITSQALVTVILAGLVPTAQKYVRPARTVSIVVSHVNVKTAVLAVPSMEFVTVNQDSLALLVPKFVLINIMAITACLCATVPVKNLSAMLSTVVYADTDTQVRTVMSR
jgi:hypothetical protein